MKELQPPEPGTVWWCDGLALSFEAHFKRRPVLVLGVREREGDDGEPICDVVVAPLSSKRRHGQEQAVTHRGGVSYLTGQVATVPPEALLSPLGAWEGFAQWAAEQNTPAERPKGVMAWLARIFRARRPN